MQLGPRSSPPLNKEGILLIQHIVGAILYYTQAVDKKNVSINELGSQQAFATENTANVIVQLGRQSEPIQPVHM